MAGRKDKPVWEKPGEVQGDGARTRLTRRAFLGVSASLPATPILHSLAASNAINLTLTEEAAGATTRRNLLATYGATASWPCLMANFGADARHNLDHDSSVEPGKELTVSVTNVRFPGTTLGFDIDLTFKFVDGKPALRIVIPAYKLDALIDFVDWSSGLTPFSGVLSAKQATALAKSLDHRSVRTDGRIILGMEAGGRFILEPVDGPLTVMANDVAVPLQRAYLAANPEIKPADFPAASLLDRKGAEWKYEPTAHRTRLWGYLLAAEAGGELGHTPHVGLSLSNVRLRSSSDEEQPPVSLVFSDQSPKSKTCVVAKAFELDGAAGFSSQDGSWDDHVNAWPSFSLLGGKLEQIIVGKHTHATLTASFRASSTYSADGHVPLSITGTGGVDFVAEVGDDARLAYFKAQAKLDHAFVPMDGADYSRIDFADTEIRYGLGELEADPQATAVSAGYWLACPPVFSAVMDNRAIVRVMRSADLLTLGYSFRDIYLVSLPGATTLDSCENCLPGFKLEPGRAPLMIVRFPAQHIAEKAFLEVRQISDKKAVKPEGDVNPATGAPEQHLLATGRAYDLSSGSTNGSLFDIGSKLKDKTEAEKAKILAQNQSAAVEARDKDIKDLRGSAKDILEALDHVIEARIAGPTRLVFEFDQKTFEADPETRGTPMLPRAYSVDALTSWHGLKAKVATRALRRDALIVDQLRIAGIDETTPAADKTSIIDRNLDPPTPEDTAIEFPYRLLLSPADDARWDTSLPPTQERLKAGVPLWSAKLDLERGGRSVRALWSPDFHRGRKGFFLDRKLIDHSNDRPWVRDWLPKAMGRPKYRMSLDARDRQELVTLTSVYGLPALLPVPDPNLVITSKAGDDTRATSTVFPIPKPFAPEHGKLSDEGVFVPQPLASARMALTSLGATVDLQGQWEPPSGFTLEAETQPLWPALTVERWHHQAFLGRDTFVEIVYKGFLFPLGHRCSIIKSTERKFRPDPDIANGKAPVAYLIQRYFIVIGEPEKRFPAVGQRYDGRALFARSMTMLTTTTADILDPYEHKLSKSDGTLVDVGSSGGAAFFPKTQEGTGVSGAVEFEYEVAYSDGEKRKLMGPLIVVDNTLAHDPAGIRKLVAYYNSGEIEVDGRTADAGKQRFRYAEDKSAGTTEYVTDHWELGSHGRKVADPIDSDFQFTMDAVMEGADQPPFYPNCLKASVEVQSLNYMNGKSLGFTEASYDLNYLENGFSPANNPSGIFLSLSGKRSDLTLDSNTKASGGLATPNMRAVALSREKGPVGGAKPTANLATTLGTGAITLTSATARTSADIELSVAQSGKFDALEALANAIKLPKLFGIIPLQKLIPILGFIDGAPQAVESTAYSIANGADQFVAAAQEIAGRVDDVLNRATAQIDESLAAYSRALGIKDTPIKLVDLYPGLAGALGQLHAVLAALLAAGPAVQAGNFSTGTEAIGRTAAAIRAALQEVKGVTRHPTPAILDDLVKRLTEAFRGLGDAIRAIVREQLQLLLGDIAAELTLTVVFERSVRNGKPSELTLYVNDEPPVQLTDSDPETHPLYQVMSAALTGRPDSWVSVTRVEQGITRHYERLELVFNPQNLPKLHVDAVTAEAKAAASAATAQALTEVLLYDDVTKPLIEGYERISNLIATIEQEADDIERQLRELPRQLVLALAEWITGLVSLQKLYAIANELRADAKALARDAFNDFVAPLLHDLKPMTGVASAMDAEMASAVDALDVPVFSPSLRSALDEERVKLTKLRAQLRTALADYEQLRAQLADLTGNDLVNDFDRGRVAISQSLGKFFAAQADVLTAARDVIAVANDAIKRGRQFATDELAKRYLFAIATAQQLALDIAKGVLSDKSIDPDKADLSRPGANAILARIEAIDPGAAALLLGRVRQLNEAITQVRTEVDKAKATINSAPVATLAELDDAVARAERFLITEISTTVVALAAKSAGGLLAELARYEQAATGLAMRGLLIGEKALAELDARVFPPVKRAIGRAFTLITSHDNPTGLYAVAERVRTNLDPDIWLTPHQDVVDIVKLFLNPKIVSAFENLGTTGKDNLEAERKIFLDVQQDFERATGFSGVRVASIKNLVERLHAWRHGTLPEPAKIFEPVQQAADLLLSSKLSDLIDLGALERELAKQLIAFLPLQLTFDYDWGVPLKAFPSESSRMFWIDSTRKGTGFSQPLPAFAPFKDKVRKPSHDLVIYARAGVDLRDPLNPKPIFIAQAEIQYANIHLFGPGFDVVTVKFDQIRFTVDDTGSDFRVQLAPDPVEFGEVVEFIKELSRLFGGGNGIYLRPAFGPLGVIIGYRYAQDEIPLGTISLLNFAIDISVRLSFDNTPVSFRFALAERDKPLTIICTPYGGAGYLALRTVASDIVLFEMQLEFGGAVAISFPPLSAHGFVSAGIYIEKSEGKALILEGFVRAIGEGSIVCFTISVFFEVRIHQEGSNVRGQLTVRVSFKVGFVTLSYSYTAAYQFSGKQGGSSRIEQAGPRLRVKSADRVKQWRKYRAYFAEIPNG